MRINTILLQVIRLTVIFSNLITRNSTRSSLNDMFSYIWPSADSTTPTNTSDVPTSPSTNSVSKPTLWCVCVWEDYVDPIDCCGRGSRDRVYNAFSIVRAHTKQDALLHFVPNQYQKNVKITVAPYTIGKWMDEDDYFDFQRDDTVLLGYD